MSKIVLSSLKYVSLVYPCIPWKIAILSTYLHITPNDTRNTETSDWIFKGFPPEVEVFLAHTLRNFIKPLCFSWLQQYTSASRVQISTRHANTSHLSKNQHSLLAKRLPWVPPRFFSLKSPYGRKFLRIEQHMQFEVWRHSPPILGNSLLNCNLLGKPHCFCCHVLSKLIQNSFK